MTPPRSVVVAIAKAVENAGGDMADVDDLVAAWTRIQVDQAGRVDRMRSEARTVRCCCADGGVPAPDGRCERCYGRPS